MGLLGHMMVLYLIFWGTSKLFIMELFLKQGGSLGMLSAGVTHCESVLLLKSLVRTRKSNQCSLCGEWPVPCGGAAASLCSGPQLPSSQQTGRTGFPHINITESTWTPQESPLLPMRTSQSFILVGPLQVALRPWGKSQGPSLSLCMGHAARPKCKTANYMFCPHEANIEWVAILKHYFLFYCIIFSLMFQLIILPLSLFPFPIFDLQRVSWAMKCHWLAFNSCSATCSICPLSFIWHLSFQPQFHH